MNARFAIAAACAALFAGTVAVTASDRIALYVLVDKVTMEPNEQAPERVRIWGAFAAAKPNDRNDYLAPQIGYVYFRLPPSRPDLARREWMDLKAHAGKRLVIGLGSRDSLKFRVRPSTEAPTEPDVYTLESGLYRISSDTLNAPVKLLLELTAR